MTSSVIGSKVITFLRFFKSDSERRLVAVVLEMKQVEIFESSSTNVIASYPSVSYNGIIVNPYIAFAISQIVHSSLFGL